MASNSLDLCPCYGVVLLALHYKRGRPEVELRRVVADQAHRLGLSTTRGRGGRRQMLGAAIKLEIRGKDRRAADRGDIETCCAWIDHLREREFLISTMTAAQRTRWFVGHLRFSGGLGADAKQRAETLKRMVAAMEEAVPALRAAEPQYRRARGRSGRMVLAQVSGNKPIDEESVQRRLRRPFGKLRTPRIDLNTLMGIEKDLGVAHQDGQQVLDTKTLDWLRDYVLRTEPASRDVDSDRDDRDSAEPQETKSC